MPQPHGPAPVPSPDSHRYAKLILDRSSHHIKLVSYIIDENKKTEERIVIWNDVYGGIIRHTIPMGIKGIPYTSHSVQEPEKTNVVVFRHWNSKGHNTPHKFMFEDDDSQSEILPTPEYHCPEYHFLSDTDSREFQERVRGRRLLKTFDTEEISIVQKSNLLITQTISCCRKRPIKLWRRTDTAITFFATSKSIVEHQRHLQFYLSWLKRDAELPGDRKLVLKFNRQKDVDQQQPAQAPDTPKRRQLSFASLTARRKSSAAESSSQGLDKIHDGELKTDKSVNNSWESLEIQFTHGGDAEDFVELLRMSQNEPGAAPSNGPYFVSQGPRKPSFPPPTPGPIDNSQPSEEEKRKRAAIEEWWKKFNDNRDEIFPIITDNYAPVRIAILDTGIDFSNPYVDKNWRSKKFYRDFLKDDDAASLLKTDSLGGYSEHYVRQVVGDLAEGRQDCPMDLAGHGTHLAGIVLQLTPHAHLCVARVLEDNLTTYDTGEAAKRVALAILYAVQKWKVKVINLSIGFDQEKLSRPERQVLIHALQYARQLDVVVFAAASNSANRQWLAFPACEPDHVLSINSTNGSGGRSWFNPLNQEYHENLSILGEWVKSTWLQADYGKENVFKIGDSVWKRQEGTSQATTIAACVAVLILQFGRQYGVGERLETFKGVRAVLRAMADGKTGDGFRDMVPWMQVFQKSPDNDVDVIKRGIEVILDKARISN